MNDALVGNLKELEIFRGLDDAKLLAIVMTSGRVVFRADQKIISAGEAGDGAVLLVGGDAEVVSAETGETLQSVPPGSLLGEMAMLVEHDYRITVVARSTVRALKLARTDMHELMQKDAALAAHFVHRINSRLMRLVVELNSIDQTLALAAETSEAA